MTRLWTSQRNHKGQGIGAVPYSFVVYAASKTEGRTCNVEVCEGEETSFRMRIMMIELFKEGKRAPLPPQHYIDVIDDARLHVIAAVLDEKSGGERVFAFTGPFNHNDAVDAVQKTRKDGKVELKKDENEARDLSKTPNELGARLLKEWYGQEGYKSFEQSVKENLEGVEP